MLYREEGHIAKNAGDLRIAGLSKAFAGLRALTDVSFTVGAGQLVGLIGPNGAGKTTVFNCITGLIPPDTGTVFLGDVPIHGRRPEEVARFGVVRTFQNIRMFPKLTVFESFLAPQYLAGSHTRREGRYLETAGVRHRRGERRSRKQRVAVAEEMMELLSLQDVANRRSGELGLLIQRKIELGRALLATPRVLLLDEPSAGATAKEARELKAIVETLPQAGISILIVEHNIPFIMDLATEIVALDFGRVIAIGSPDAIRNDPQVRAVYLGT
ncbi:MAG: ABC transporter ATP-binding protein [Bryobacterales bacterium]|nr:ABC transporter ATP-binding protein [Bryobacterales bacterium]